MDFACSIASDEPPPLTWECLAKNTHYFLNPSIPINSLQFCDQPGDLKTAQETPLQAAAVGTSFAAHPEPGAEAGRSHTVLHLAGHTGLSAGESFATRRVEKIPSWDR